MYQDQMYQGQMYEGQMYEGQMYEGQMYEDDSSIFDILFYTIVGLTIGIIVFLLILSIYAYFFKANPDRMKRLYDLGGKLSTENKVTNFLRRIIEKYLEYMLTIPGFNFDTPVYFNELGDLVPIEIPTDTTQDEDGGGADGWGAGGDGGFWW